MFRQATRIAVRIAVAHVIIISFGVLGTGATQDWWTLVKRHPPFLTQWVLNWGVTLMLVPIAWTCWFLRVHRDEHASPDLKRTATQVGLILGAMLLALMLWASLSVLGCFDGYDPDKRVEEMAAARVGVGQAHEFFQRSRAF
ncbi:MAG: hypothetical protein HY299_07880 [Verrucomicrobia bacterium]|nr:hypothetical protein [Verrucomicrobiota bacterium]